MFTWKTVALGVVDRYGLLNEMRVDIGRNPVKSEN